MKTIFSKPSYATRLYLKDGLDKERFFDALNKSNINYVLLRWFETWPLYDRNEDLDILVSDKHLEQIRKFCVIYDNGNQKLDIYSETGRDNSGYNGASYFTENLARNILETRVFLHDKVYVPSGENYFLSLAYHVVFHKGQEAGLPFSKNNLQKSESDHDYGALLMAIVQQFNIICNDITFCGLYNFLKKMQAVPERDTMALYARSNLWLCDLILDIQPTDTPSSGDVIILVIREWAAQHNKIEQIIQCIKDEKLHIIEYIKLDNLTSRKAKINIRGNQWGAGPYPISGGNPHSLVVCFDYSPKKPSKRTRSEMPFVSNENIFIKHRIRDMINADQFRWNQVNCIHSSDNEKEANDYIRVLGEDKFTVIAEKIREIRRSAYFFDWNIKEVFVENGTRAKTCLIDHQGSMAVLKVFKPEARRFFEREKFVYENFSPELKLIPKKLQIGENYIITQYYDNLLLGESEQAQKEIIRKHTFEILKFLKFFYDRGYAILGFYPGNLIITPEDTLVIIDFEFLLHYEKKPASFAQSYDLVGVPQGFAGDMPRGDINHTLQNTWEGYLDPKILSNFLSQG